MNLNECYDILGGSLDDALSRLASEKNVYKFLNMFPDDGSYKLLTDSLGSGDAKEAFRAAHSLKGVCLNLGLGNLFKSSNELTDALRSGTIPEDYKVLYDKVTDDYNCAVDAIRHLDPA